VRGGGVIIIVENMVRITQDARWGSPVRRKTTGADVANHGLNVFDT